VAVVEQDGQVREELQVARYRSPGAQRPGRVRALSVARRGGSLVLRWRDARGAARHEVAVRLSDGRRLVLPARGARLAVPRVAARTRGVVRVRGVSRDGMRGPAVRRKV
jgi:hypothetical protein